MLAASLAFPLHGFAQQEADAARGRIEAVDRLIKQRPSDPALWFYMSRFQAQAGDRQASVSALQKVLELGEGFLPTRDGFAAVWEDPGFRAVRDKLEARLPRLDYAPTAFELEDRGLIPEGIAYDAPSRSFFLGSIAQRRVVRLTEDREMTEFAGPSSGLDEVLGVAVDAPRRRLYVVSTSALTTAGRAKLRNAVFAFDIDSRRLVQRYDVPGARQLNDVAVARGGRVFASDSESGAIFEIAVKGPGPSRQLVAPGQMGGSNGLAVSPDARRLYVAHNTGLGVVDIATGNVSRVRNDTRENLAAIDGLYEWQGQLVGVQNATNPGRVVLATLSREGDAVTRVQTLLSHHHNALDEPTTGAVTDRGFFLLAATGVTRYNRDGVIERPESVPAPAVVRIPLPR